MSVASEVASAPLLYSPKDQFFRSPGSANSSTSIGGARFKSSLHCKRRNQILALGAVITNSANGIKLKLNYQEEDAVCKIQKDEDMACATEGPVAGPESFLQSGSQGSLSLGKFLQQRLLLLILWFWWNF